MAKSRTTFQKGKSGNPGGKPLGARHRASQLVDELFEGQAESIAKRAAELALEGHPVALRAVLDRISPVRRDRPIIFALPPIETTADLTKATSALLSAVAAGELTPSEAAELGKLVDAHVKAIELTDIHERLARLEEGQSR